jgi:hypothetical protein
VTGLDLSELHVEGTLDPGRGLAARLDCAEAFRFEMGSYGNANRRRDVDVKTFLYNFFWQTWPDSLKPTSAPDRYTLHIASTRRAWARQVDRRASKEAKKFAEANGYHDAKIVNRDRNRLRSTFDYTIDFVR